MHETSRAISLIRGGLALTLASALVIIVALTIAGCSSSGGGTDPEVVAGIDVTMSRAQAQPGQEVTAAARATYRDGRAVEVDWYVDGIAGGDTAVGTITQTNPATYTAPLVPPAAGSVTIEARYDTLITDTATLPVVFTIVHVDAVRGDDDAGTGVFSNPFQTITKGVTAAADWDTILVHPGTYDETLGESFTITIPWRSTLRGAAAESCVIVVGESSYGLWLNEDSTIEHFTLDVAQGTSPHRGIGMTNTSTIRDIRTSKDFTYSVVKTRYELCDGLIEDCVFVNTEGFLGGRGFEIADDSLPTIRNCVIDGYSYGIFVNTECEPRIEGCTIQNCSRGVIIYSDLSLPDLGGGAQGSVGGNTIVNNADGLMHGGTLTVYAIGNTWGSDPPVVGTQSDIGNDITLTNTGTVVYE